jgi:putative Mg2+ transporter-C (MgtC) family protein
MIDVFSVPDAGQVVRVVVRILAAAVLGGVIGFQRQRAGKPAGLRTHMLVAMGCAIFVLAAREAGVSVGDSSRVIQGVATGIGFIGGGTIVKHLRGDEVHGLTSAASIWLTSALGISIGLGQLWLPLVAVVSAFIVLSFVERLERAFGLEQR